MSFAFNARYGLFTYAQCGSLDPFEVVAHFSSMGAECIIGRENHEDGGTHLHAFADFGKKLRTRDAHKFDVGGCHANISPSRGTPEKGYDYAIKDGDVVAGGLERPASGKRSSDDTWSTIVAATSAEEFWRLVSELAPRSLVCNFPSLRTYAEWRFRVERAEYLHPASVHLDTGNLPGLSLWAHENIDGGTVGGELSCTFAMLPTGGDPHRWGAPTPPSVALRSAWSGTLLGGILTLANHVI